MVGVGGHALISTKGRSPERNTPIGKNIKCLIICIIAALGVWQYNMDTTLLNGFQAMPCFLAVFGYRDPTLPNGYGIDATFQSLVTSLLQLGLIPTSVGYGYISKYIGRRPCYWVATVVSFIGVIIQMTVEQNGVVYLARILIGLGNGIFVNTTVIYISECAPAHFRGSFVAMFQVVQNAGGIIGAIVNNFTSNLDATGGGRSCYQIPLGILFIVPSIVSVGMFFCPETPRWLLLHDRPEQARKSLRILRGNEFPEELLTEEYEEIRQTIVLEQELGSNNSWKDMFRGADLSRTLTTCGATMCHSGSGINFLVGYAVYFYQIAGIPTNKAFQYSIILQCVATIAATLGTFLNRYVGRRPIMISGTIVCMLSMFIVAGVYAGSNGSAGSAGLALVAFTNIYLAGYSYSIGPVAWVVAGETPSNRLRSMTLGLAMAVQFLFAWLCTFTLPYFFNPQHLGWGPKIGKKTCVSSLYTNIRLSLGWYPHHCPCLDHFLPTGAQRSKFGRNRLAFHQQSPCVANGQV